MKDDRTDQQKKDDAKKREEWIEKSWAVGRGGKKDEKSDTSADGKGKKK